MNSRDSQLLERLARHARDHADRPAIIGIATKTVLTYAQLQADVHALADELQSRFKPRSTIILRCSNTPRFHVAFFAVLATGMTIFPAPCGVTEPELEALIAKSAATGIITESRIESISRGASHGFEPALLLQSSGTTGLPKIVRRNPPSLDAVSSQMVEAIGIGRSDRILACVPLCHSYGLEHGLLAPIWSGATVHLADGFDLDTIRRELIQRNVTIFPCVPSVCEMLANLHDENDRFHSLRLTYSAGGPLPVTIFEKLRDRCGIIVGQLYGATEIGSVTFAHPDHPSFDPASVGQPMRGVDLRIDPDHQLLVRAASMMSNYVGDNSTVSPDGFFPTGDLARSDDHGNLHITGRLKFLIDVGGLKVNPMEVELAIAQHPGVAACVVVPTRLSETVSRLKAIITPADADDPPQLETLRSFARQRLSSHKVPRVFEIRASLPRSSTGKVLRHLLAETS